MVQLEISRRLETLKRTIRSSEQSAIEILNANLGQGFAKGRFCHKIKLCEVRSISKKSSIFFQRRREGPSLSRIPSLRRNRAAASECLQELKALRCATPCLPGLGGLGGQGGIGGLGGLGDQRGPEEQKKRAPEVVNTSLQQKGVERETPSCGTDLTRTASSSNIQALISTSQPARARSSSTRFLFIKFLCFCNLFWISQPWQKLKFWIQQLKFRDWESNLAETATINNSGGERQLIYKMLKTFGVPVFSSQKGTA